MAAVEYSDACIPPGAQPLNAFAPGTRVRIAMLLGGRTFQARAASMGLRTGAEITVLQGGGLWGPLLVRAGESRFAVGRGMARHILVLPLQTD